MRFAAWPFLFLALLLPLLIWRHSRARRTKATLLFSSLPRGEGLESHASRMRDLPLYLTVAALLLFIVAAARPQFGLSKEEIKTEGIDIVLVLDASGTMRAIDFQPENRLYVAKKVAKEFIQSRKNDRIGLVVFSAKAFTQCPLTIEYGVLTDLLDKVHFGMVEDGTAIGMAIGTAVNRLRESKAKSKVIVLLTDGRNNRGEIDPITAAKLAQAMGVRIYAIGAGAKGQALYPVEDRVFGTRYVRMDVDIDDETLQQIAQITGGKYFRATDAQRLEEIYKEIAQMEKTALETKVYKEYSEKFTPFLGLGLLLVALSMLVGSTRLRQLP
jgi:Ca-activated chloride channel family protein